jgi:hypothetical protein
VEGSPDVPPAEPPGSDAGALSVIAAEGSPMQVVGEGSRVRHGTHRADPA